MHYDAFSRNVHQVLELATALAKRYGCGYIGSEHILFGLLNVKDGRSASILKEAGVDNNRYLSLFEKTVEKGVILSGNMLTPRTKQLFEKALEISLKAHSGFVGTEHLLLAILISTDSVAVTILKTLRVNVERLAEDLFESMFGGNIEEQEGEIKEEESLFKDAYKSFDFIREHITPTGDVVDRLKPVYNFKG